MIGCDYPSNMQLQFCLGHGDGQAVIAPLMGAFYTTSRAAGEAKISRCLAKSTCFMSVNLEIRLELDLMPYKYSTSARGIDSELMSRKRESSEASDRRRTGSTPIFRYRSSSPTEIR